MNKDFKSTLILLVGLIIVMPQFIMSQVKPTVLAQANDEAAVKNLAISFLQAVIKREWKTLYELSANSAAIELPSGRKRLQDWNHLDELTTENPQFLRITIQASKASLRLKVQFKAIDPKNPPLPVSFDFGFQKISNAWKVSSADSSSDLFVQDFISAKNVLEEQSLIEKESDLLATEGLDVAQYYLEKNNDDDEENPGFSRLLDAIIRLSNDVKINAVVLWYYGESFVRKRDYPNALSSFQKGFQLGKEAKDDNAQGINLVGLSGVYVYQGERSKSEQFLTEAITFFSKNSALTKNASWAPNKVGAAFYNTKAYETALKLYKQAYELGVSQNNKNRQAISLQNIGVCYFQMNNFSEAQISFEKSLAVVVYAPSLGVLSQMQEIKTNQQKKDIKKTGKDILAIGNPTNTEQILKLKPTMKFIFENNTVVERLVRRNIELSPLPGATVEAKALSTIYGSSRVQLRISPVETKEQFIQEAGKYRLLHIATHGILDNSNPMNSALVFGANPINKLQTNASKKGNVNTPDEENFPQENQLLHAYEIMKMNLNADLVVLSACDTANGKVNEGEGLVGLSWAFLVAGVPTVVSSQWAVRDQSTEILMKDFYQRLNKTEQNGENPRNIAVELRNASLFLMNKKEQYRHPYYWAAFLTIGAP